MPVNGLKWVAGISEFNKWFIKSQIDESDKGHRLEIDIQYPENVDNLSNDLSVSSERMKIEIAEKLAANLHDKMNIFIMLYT